MFERPTLKDLYECLEFTEKSIKKTYGRDLAYVLYHFHRYTYTLMVEYLPHYRIHIGHEELKGWDYEVNTQLKRLECVDEFIDRANKESSYPTENPDIINRCGAELCQLSDAMLTSVSNTTLDMINTFKTTIKNRMENSL